jgi:hypothetical protein
MKKHASFAQPLAGGEHPYTKKNLVFLFVGYCVVCFGYYNHGITPTTQEKVKQCTFH